MAPRHMPIDKPSAPLTLSGLAVGVGKQAQQSEPNNNGGNNNGQA